MEQIFSLTKRLTHCKLDSFTDIYEKIDHLFDNELNDIDNIRKHIYRQFDERKNQNQKCLAKSIQYRNEGDIKFKNDLFDDALDLYNSAVMCASYPLESDDETDDELCNAFKSRSKTFLRMQNYGNALYDIECAILLLSHHQVIARLELMLDKVNCLKHLSRIVEARQLVSMIIELIPCYPVNNELVLDAITLKESLSSNQSQSETQLLENKTDNMIEICEELGNWTHNSCQLSNISGKGRHYVASDPINHKSIVMIEKSYAEVLFMNQLGTHCGNCFKNIGYQYWPCRHCSQVIFCSSQCAKQAYYHRFECGITDLINKLGPTHYLVFRIFLRIGTENVLKLFPYIDSSINFDDLENIDESKELLSYLKFMQLMDHTEKHDIYLKVVALIGSIQLTFILEYLKQINYKTDNKLEMHKKLTKALILHFFKVTINAFGIYEPQSGSSNSEHIGNAICLNTSFFNHNCDPNIYWHFNGTYVTSITNRHINSGEELSITYGPLHTIPVNERQNLLTTKYFFTCDCQSCVRDLKQALILKCFNSQITCSGWIVCNRESVKAQCLKCSKMFEIAKTIEDIDRSKNQFDFIINEFQSYQNLTDQSKSYLQSAENFHEEFCEILDDKCEILNEIRTKLSRSYEKIGDYSKALNLSKQVLTSIDDKQSLNYYKEIIYLSKVFYLYLFHQKESLAFDNDCLDCVSVISETIEKLEHCKNRLLENSVQSNLESHEKQAMDKRLNVIENLLSIKQKHVDSVLKLKDN